MNSAKSSWREMADAVDLSHKNPASVQKFRDTHILRSEDASWFKKSSSPVI
jgi:hypothetical protein